MKFGVLGFRYNSPIFHHFGESLDREGFYTVNLGDNSQTIATRHIYKRLGVSDDDIIVVNRDTLREYDGEPCIVLMNAVFTPDCFPISPKILPLFVGLASARPGVLRDNVDYYKLHEPIGCRDITTTDELTALGVKAFTTGCVTLAMDGQWQPPAQPKLLIVYGANGGDLPAEVLKFVPPDLLDTAEFIFHRYPMSDYPVSEEKCLAIERYEAAILKRYKTDASLILTSLHHVATPCLAMGVPVILCRRAMDRRFTYIKEIMPLYLPGSFETIDWYPSPVDVAPIRDSILETVKAKLSALAHATPSLIERAIGQPG